MTQPIKVKWHTCYISELFKYRFDNVVLDYL